MYTIIEIFYMKSKDTTYDILYIFLLIIFLTQLQSLQGPLS